MGFMPKVEHYIKPGYRIADIGSGTGSYWWTLMPAGCQIDGFDPYFAPADPPEFVTIIKMDGVSLYQHPQYKERYDYAVADHVFEHVSDPVALCRSLHHCLKPGAYTHLAIPDASFFTDRFYRLIHKNGGGHIFQHTRTSFTALMEDNGFTVEEVNPWPDDWAWLERCYNLEYQQVEHLTQDELEFIAQTLRAALPPANGHYYGWEFIVRKEDR